eukprot:scpid25144/ scgid33885/ 
MIWPEWTSLHISGTMPVTIGCKCKNNQWTLLLPQLAQVDNLSTLMRNIASMSSMQRKQYSLASGENRVQMGFGVGNMSATSSMLRNWKTVCSSVYCISESTGGV